MANRDPDGAEHSRAGYIAAIIVSALGHAAVVAVVVWVIPQLLQSHFTAPPAYTVKIVDSLPAGDLGTHLPRLDTRAEEEQQKEPPKVAPPLSEPLAPPEDKSALALNSVATPTPTIPAPEPTAIATIAPTVAATITPTEAPTPIAMKTTAIKPRVKPQPAAAPSSEIARATRTPSVAERLAALKAQMLAEHLAETAKDNGEATDDQSKSSAEPSGGGPIAANKASAGMGAGIGPGTGSSGIQQDLDFLLYYRTVQESIKKAWSFSGGNPELQTVVNFAIAADGALTGVKIAQSSHDSAFDESVVRAIRKAAPFPAPPEKYRAQFAGGIEAMFKLGELSS